MTAATVQSSDVRGAPHDLYANGRLLHVGVTAEQVRINVRKAHMKGFDLAQEADGTVCLLGRRFVPQAPAPPPAAHACAKHGGTPTTRPHPQEGSAA